LSDVRALPGVTHAGYISFLPMTLRGGIWPVSIDGRPADRGGPNVASLRFVTPGLFATLGIPLRLGRDVTESDTDDSLLVAVVSESFVQHYFPSGDPMGRRFHFGLRERTIVGVVGNVRVRGLERKSEPQVYLPYRQVADDGFAVWYAPKDLAIKTSGDPSALMPAVRAIIARVDPRQSISDIRPLTEIVDRETAARSVQVRVLGGFASLAVLLAGIGIYGVLAFSVSKQSREIGVRLALGAQRRDILLMVLRRALRWGVAGIAIGVALAYATGRILQALLAGVSPADPATFALAIVISLVMATIGGLLPAVRAVRVSPLIAIRTE
jgi:predicted permease